MNQNTVSEEIAFIKNIIRESRSSFALNGKPFIFWGIIIVVGLLMEFLRRFFLPEFHSMYFVWILLIAVGWIYAYIESRKHKNRSKAKSLGPKILGSIWLACGISMTIIGFIGTISGAIKGVYVSPVLSLMLAIAYFVSGVIYEYKWLRNLSIGWWLGAIVMFFFPSQFTTLIMALLMIFLQIVPGIILLKIVRKNESQTA